MIPVRRLERSKAPKRGCSSSAMNIVGTPYSDVQRSASTARSVATRVEARARDDQAGAVGEAGQVAEHHAEAVVEGHRHADPVVLGVAQDQPREVAVVEDVAVRERGALRGAGGARGELDVDRVVGIERRLDRRQVGLGHALAVGQQVVPVVLEDDRLAQQRAARADLVEHRDVVGLAEAAGEDEQAHAGLGQRVLAARPPCRPG